MLHAAFSYFAGRNVGTAVGTDFPYLPLLAGLKEIRLLELEATGSCQLRYVPLDSAPMYIALSYAWGDPTRVASYSVDGKKILISKSLSAALARIFSFCKDKIPNNWGRRLHVWADAICIDQSNDEEKASQVILMGEIYKGANKVMVYLGEDTMKQDSGAAISIIRSCAKVYDEYSGDKSRLGGIYWKEKYFEKLPRLSHGNHLVSFFERPWWNRIWTLQEMFHGRGAFILCGKHHIEWADIVKAAHFWRDIDNISAACGHDDALVASAIYKSGLAAKATFESYGGWSGSSGFSWLSMLASTIKFASTDPRDKLYALTGMSEAIPGFEISYTKPVAEVFKDFMKKYLEQSKDLEFLQLAGVNHKGEPVELPAWIPNFMNLDHPMLNYHDKLQNDNFAAHIKNSFKVWNASCRFAASLQQPTAESEFRPEGVRVGTIDKICGPNNGSGREPGWLNLAYKRFGTEYHPLTMRCHILQAYFRTLFGDRYEIANKQVLEFEKRFELAGTFWHLFRKPFALLFQKMEISGRIDEILLGEPAKRGFRVEPSSQYSSVMLALFSKFTSLYFFVTSNGYMGYGPKCRRNDIVCILFGCSIPLILRPRNHEYIIVGQCFVLGVMNGELLSSYGDGNDGIDTREVFDIL